MSRGRTILLNIGLLLISCLVGLLVLEGMVRITGLQPMHNMNPPIHRVASGGLVFELVPSYAGPGYNKETVTINSLGFRSPELDPSKPTIAVVGDSMTFGLGVEDTQTNPAVLGQMFPDYNILNMGVSGYNMQQSALAYRKHQSEFTPSLVILEFVINDADPLAHFNSQGVLTTEDLTKEQEEQKLRTAITAAGTWKIPGKVWLHEHSALFTFIERRTKGMWFRAKTSLLAPEWTPEMRAYYTQWFDDLNASVANTPKLFVRWPDNWLHPETTLWVDQLASSRGWKVLDLSDLFGIRYENLGWDQHPSAETQQKAAQAIHAFIVREGLVR